MISLFLKNKKQPPLFQEPAEADLGWLGSEPTEGELQLDAYQTENRIVIKSTAAGVKPEDLAVSLSGELLTIRGRREQDESVALEDYLRQECYWGSFSRSLLLPVPVDPNNIEAYLENGVLTVILTKSEKPKGVVVKVKE